MKYKKEDILELLKIKAKELGRMPKKEEITEDSRLPSYETYRKYFGDLRQLSKIIGYKLIRKHYDSEEEFIKLKNWGEKLGRMPTVLEIKETHSFPSPTTLSKYFGSWKKLREKLGFPVNRRIIYTDEELLRLLRVRADKLGRAPTIKEVLEDRSLPALGTYIARFGSLGRALKVAGYKGRGRGRMRRKQFI